MTELLLFDTVGANSIPAQYASEGTLLVLGILAVLYGENRPQVLLLDDLDRGLHPKAQLELVTFLRTLLENQPGLQLIATTHSPYILDRLNSEEVRLVTLRDGWAVCGRLQDHPEFERWKEEMTPGEFWMMFGEKWLSGTDRK
jgi:predicted ATPase